MTVNWLVDTYILESRSVVGDLLQAIKYAGYRLHSTRYIPLADFHDQDYGPESFKEGPTVLYGTHGYIKRCKIPFIPGAFGLTDNLNCNVYYSYVPNEWMLNENFIMLPFGVLKKNPRRVFEIFDAPQIFLRPLSGFKTFAGFVVRIDDIDFELNSSQQLTSVRPETVCLIANVQKLQAEFRFLVVNGEVVDGSEYRWDNVLDIRHDYDVDCFKLAQKMAAHDWQPDSVYTCDVALTSNGPKIIELNGFACAGLYAMDMDIVVNRVSEQALKEFYGTD